MIFASKNEEGIPAWKQVVEGTKTRTRRLKPVDVGKYRAVQPKRCKKGVGFVHIQGCVEHREWWDYIKQRFTTRRHLDMELKEEANREGFNSWRGLTKWFEDKDIDIHDTYILSLYYVDKKPEEK